MLNVWTVLLAFLLLPSILQGRWTVCVHDTEEMLNAPLRAAMLREFRAVMHTQGARMDFGECPSNAGRVQLEILEEPPEGLEGVLGLAYRRNERIEPRLKVFYGPIVRFVGNPNSGEAVGRALARVAAHEAAHYIQQRPTHCRHGLLQSSISAQELLATSRTPFRAKIPCRPETGAPSTSTVLLSTKPETSTGAVRGDR